MATANGRGGRMCQSYECVDVCNVSVRWSRRFVSWKWKKSLVSIQIWGNNILNHTELSDLKKKKFSR